MKEWTIAHSAKGTSWKKHKYIRKDGNRYYYKKSDKPFKDAYDMSIAMEYAQKDIDKYDKLAAQADEDARKVSEHTRIASTPSYNLYENIEYDNNYREQAAKAARYYREKGKKIAKNILDRYEKSNLLTKTNIELSPNASANKKKLKKKASEKIKLNKAYHEVESKPKAIKKEQYQDRYTKWYTRK